MALPLAPLSTVPPPLVLTWPTSAPEDGLLEPLADGTPFGPLPATLGGVGVLGTAGDLPPATGDGDLGTEGDDLETGATGREVDEDGFDGLDTGAGAEGRGVCAGGAAGRDVWGGGFEGRGAWAAGLEGRGAGAGAGADGLGAGAEGLGAGAGFGAGAGLGAGAGAAGLGMKIGFCADADPAANKIRPACKHPAKRVVLRNIIPSIFTTLELPGPMQRPVGEDRCAAFSAAHT